MCAIFAWKYDELEAATAPDVDGPRTTSTFLSATYFWASACAGAGPCSTGVSPSTNLTFSPSGFASVLDRVLRPCRLLGAEEAGAAGHGRDERERDRALAADARGRGRCDPGAPLRGRRDHSRDEHREGEADRLLHWFLLAETLSRRGLAQDSSLNTGLAGVNDQIRCFNRPFRPAESPPTRPYRGIAGSGSPCRPRGSRYGRTERPVVCRFPWPAPGSGRARPPRGRRRGTRPGRR